MAVLNTTTMIIITPAQRAAGRVAITPGTIGMIDLVEGRDMGNGKVV